MTGPDVQQILRWPPETWSPVEVRQVNERRAWLHSQLFALADEAERFERNLTAEERERFDAMQAEYDRLTGAVPSQR